MKEFNILGNFKDNKINKDYSLVSVSAKTLGEYLKNLYSEKGIDLDNHNKKDYGYEDIPPQAIYEYQNFFLMENEDGEYILLDGFRRLLWYNAPDVNITVRIYKQSDLSNKEILTLLTDLNHFKFYGGGSYHERGFSLLLKTVFGLNIHDYMTAFDGYLYCDATKHGYSTSENSKRKYDTVMNRITNEKFVSDINFISEIYKSGFMVDKFVGADIFKRRLESDNEFDTIKFIEYLKINKSLKALMEKYQKYGTTKSAKSMDVVNKILGIYDNAFTLLDGGDIELSYAEKLDECKELVKKLRKDKSLIKVTGSQKYYLIDRELERRINNKEEIEFVFVVFPNESNHTWGGELIKMDFGLHTQKIKHIRTHTHLMATTHFFGFNYDGKFEVEFTHNYQGKKYTTLEYRGVKYRLNHDVEVFARFPKEILKG